MAGKQIVWDKTSERLYRTGVDRVVLFPQNNTNGTYGIGVGWNGNYSKCFSDTFMFIFCKFL